MIWNFSDKKLILFKYLIKKLSKYMYSYGCRKKNKVKSYQMFKSILFCFELIDELINLFIVF